MSSPVVTQASQKGKKEAVTKLTGMLFTDARSVCPNLLACFTHVSVVFQRRMALEIGAKANASDFLVLKVKSSYFTVVFILFLVGPSLSHFL